MKVSIKFFVLSSMLFLSACGSPSGKEQESAEAEGHEEETTIVSVTTEQMKAVNISIGTIEMKNLTTSISVNGTLAVPNQNKALVTSLAGGVLRTLNIQPGDYVRKGQVIGTITNTELSGIQQQLVSINAQLKLAEQEEDRQRELVSGNAAPLKNLQKAQAELSSLKAQKSAIQKQLSALGISASESISSFLSITAPIGGTISEITAQIGSNIDANTPIAQIINNSELHLDLFVYEKDLPEVQPGQSIHFTLTNNPGKEYDATVYSIGTAFANESKAIPVHANVINDKRGLIEGMSVTARISLGEKVYPAVPNDAIVNNGGKDYIFIVTDKKEEEHDHKDEEAHEHGKEEEDHKEDDANTMRFERVMIVKGASDVGYTEIQLVQPLPEGTKIVVKGAFFLMAKMTNAGEAHEH
jgi:RND family efflux transporter MFP subunit